MPLENVPDLGRFDKIWIQRDLFSSRENDVAEHDEVNLEYLKN